MNKMSSTQMAEIFGKCLWGINLVLRKSQYNKSCSLPRGYVTYTHVDISDPKIDCQRYNRFNLYVARIFPNSIPVLKIKHFVRISSSGWETISQGPFSIRSLHRCQICPCWASLFWDRLWITLKKQGTHRKILCVYRAVLTFKKIFLGKQKPPKTEKNAVVRAI